MTKTDEEIVDIRHDAINGEACFESLGKALNALKSAGVIPHYNEMAQLRKIAHLAANLEMVHNDGRLAQALRDWYNPPKNIGDER